jgi:hypothetical protein
MAYVKKTYAPPMKTWQTLTVVVEVPVFGDYREKDLRFDVQNILGGVALSHHRRHFNTKVLFGNVRVKSMSRKMASRTRVIRETVIIRD